MRASTRTRSRSVGAAARAALASGLVLAPGAAHVDAQRAALAQRAPIAAPTRVAHDSIAVAPPFATSLQIVAPGPQAEADGMSYRMTLTWSARPGATAYRVFTWTDAVRAWYRTAQATTTHIDVHAFKSGCTAFIVVAVADPSAGGNTLMGLETTNVLRFPLSAHPELCPVKAE
jgi:hypothetical protein